MSGKGSKPRNCFSQNFKDNYDQIDWSKKPVAKPAEKEGLKRLDFKDYLSDPRFERIEPPPPQLFRK